MTIVIRELACLTVSRPTRLLADTGLRLESSQKPDESIIADRELLSVRFPLTNLFRLAKLMKLC